MTTSKWKKITDPDEIAKSNMAYQAKLENNVPRGTSTKWSKITDPDEITQLDNVYNGTSKQSYPELIAKSAAKGVTDLAGIGGAVEGLGRLGINYASNKIADKDIVPRGTYLPSGEDIRDTIKNYTDIDLEPKPSNKAQQLISDIVDFGVGGALTGGVGGALSKATKAAKLTAALNAMKKGAGAGAITATVARGAKEAGIDPLVADIGSSVAAPAVASRVANTISKSPELVKNAGRYIAGLNPKNINVEAIQSAKNLGIDLPVNLGSSNKLSQLVESTLEKSPYFGNRIKESTQSVRDQLTNKLTRTLDEVGSMRSEIVDNHINQLYNKSRKLLPSTAKIKPTDTSNELKKIKTKSVALSPDEEKLYKTVNKLNKAYGKANKVDVEQLIDTKKSLNSTIKWDVHDANVKNRLKKVQNALLKDIDKYGKKNKKWYKSYQDAENLYKSTAKREKLEKLITDKALLDSTGDISYKKLSKILNNRNQLKTIGQNVNPEQLQELKDIATLSRHLGKKIDVNPSGTAGTLANYAGLGALAYAPLPTIGIGALLEGGTRYLTNKRLLELAYQNALKQKSAIKNNNITKIKRTLKDIPAGYADIDSSLMDKLSEE